MDSNTANPKFLTLEKMSIFKTYIIYKKDEIYNLLLFLIITTGQTSIIMQGPIGIEKKSNGLISGCFKLKCLAQPIEIEIPLGPVNYYLENKPIHGFTVDLREKTETPSDYQIKYNDYSQYLIPSAEMHLIHIFDNFVKDFSKDKNDWTNVQLLLWTWRNAVAHNGLIEFRNPKDKKTIKNRQISWGNTKISLEDEGLPILKKVNLGDLVLLLIEITKPKCEK